MLSRLFHTDDGRIRVEATDEQVTIDSTEQGCVTLPVDDEEGVVIVDETLPNWAEKTLHQIGIEGVEYR